MVPCMHREINDSGSKPKRRADDAGPVVTIKEKRKQGDHRYDTGNYRACYAQRASIGPRNEREAGSQEDERNHLQHVGENRAKNSHIQQRGSDTAILARKINTERG